MRYDNIIFIIADVFVKITDFTPHSSHVVRELIDIEIRLLNNFEKQLKCFHK